MLFIGVGGEPTAKMLRFEADLLTEAGLAPVGAATKWLAGSPSPRKTTPTKRRRTIRPPRGIPKAATRYPRPRYSTRRPRVSCRFGPRREVGRCSANRAGPGSSSSHERVIATNNHVIHGSESVKIKLRDGRWTKDVWLLAKNDHYDLALLGIDPDELHEQGVEEGEGEGEADDELTSLSLGDSDDISTGEQVVAIGNPLGLEYTLTDGIVSARRVYKGRKMIQISVPLSPGNSGGPLLNMKGEVVGISTQKVGGIRAENLNLAVPANRLEKLIQDDYPNRRRIGEDDSNSGTW